MATKIPIDDQLLQEAQKLGQKKDKTETVHEALREYVERRKQERILEAFGTVEYILTGDRNVGR